MTNQQAYLTGVEAGLSEIDQMKIALELILKQGGVATTSQIYETVEERLGKNVHLSDQGKHTLRRVINTRAVKATYILPYDKSNPGWQLTKAGEIFITNTLGYSVGRIRVTARTLVNFQLALKDVRGLLDLYQKAHVTGKQEQGLEFFKRSSLILTITAWETFFEDTFRICVIEKLRKVTSPAEMQAAFNVVAVDWYTSISQKHSKSPKPPDFVKWTGDGWKQIVENRLLDDLR